MALNIKLHIMAQSSELRQDFTIIRNFIDHSHHSLASFFLKKFPDWWSCQGFHLPPSTWRTGTHAFN